MKVLELHLYCITPVQSQSCGYMFVPSKESSLQGTVFTYQTSEEVCLTQHTGFELSKNLIIFSTLCQPNPEENLKK